MSRRSLSPPAKRAKVGEQPIEAEASTSTTNLHIEEDEEEPNNCSICLHELVDRTVIPGCSHEFCFECLVVWSDQSRRCPLCSGSIGEYLIHNIRSNYDYRKYYLPPLRSNSPGPSVAANMPQVNPIQRRRRAREWGRRQRERDEADRLERSIQKRRWIYEHHLYAKHVASNLYTKYRPYPTPVQFSTSPDLISRTTTFLRRELHVWESMDVEFLTTFTISLMKAIDIRSESAIKLLAEFLDMDTPYAPGVRFINAEHFAHEVYCYVRSPYKDLFVYDTVVQYDIPPDITPPSEAHSNRRWRENSPARSSRSGSRRRGSPRRGQQQRSRSRSISWSPSGRTYPSERERLAEFVSSTVRRDTRDYNHPPTDAHDDALSGEQSDERARKQTNTSEQPTLGVTNGQQPFPHRPCSPVDGIRVEGCKKGKQRADIPFRDDNAEGSSAAPTLRESVSEAQVDSLVSSTSGPSTPVLAPANHRAPRNRTLRDSVHAHLRKQLSCPPPTSGHQNDSRIVANSVHSGLDNGPSLLHRLSKPDARPIINTEPLNFEHTPHFSAIQVAESLEDTIRDRKKTPNGPDARDRTTCHLAAPTADLSSTLEPSQSTSKIASHSIVKQTSESNATNTTQLHGSSAQSNDYTSQQLTQQSKNAVSNNPLTHTDHETRPGPATSDNGWKIASHSGIASSRATSAGVIHVPSDDGSRRQNLILGDNSISGNGGSHHAGAPLWDTRTRLLTRLEQEKHEAVTKAALATRIKPRSTRSGSSEESGMPANEESSGSNIEGNQQKDLRVLEKRLKARMQLHSRLVAERMRAGGDLSEGS